uniref:Rpp4 candidate R7 n=1 Tax=Glycine max TaxID=3847 RepID=R4HCF6_SOYBN|nr:Rpp4 candidate R7 [Glycine max]
MDPITSATAQSALQIAEHVVKRQLGYIFNYKDKFKEVEQYIERLDDTRKRVQNEVNDAEKNGEEINDEVQHWLKQVDEKIKKYECFINDERHAQTRCSIRLIFPNNLSLRYRLGRKATKMVEEIKADGHSNKKFDKVSYRLGPSSDAALLNTGYVSFGSRNETMEKIMKALEDSTVNIVGVYGAGGVGKTTLVKEVANKAREKKLFNMVVMANVTRIPDTEKIQGQIAEMLGMRLEEESEIVRADRIRKRLMKEKESTLIILDDLWDGLNLNILGIPRSEDDDGSQQDVNDLSDFGYHKMEKEVFSADFHTMKKDKLAVDFNTMKKGKLSVDSNMIKKEKLSGDHKGCKILLTSRSKEVICNKMDVQERSTFSVGVLDENEAKTFLKKLAGIRAQSFDFDEKVIEIAKMCDGLPMALVSIGRALKNKSSFVWQDVCQRIKRQSFTEGHESIEFSVNLSFEHLKNEQLKHIFLLCARMGNDALIMDLVKFCIGLGLLQGVHTIREARNKVNMLIEELKESTLLVESLSHDRFNMHDIVRDVALSISSKEKHVFFMKNGIVDEWPHKDELERYTAICLHFCDINDGLPESIHCPRLEVLHIDSKDDFLKIPDDFFKDMIELRVLILTGVNLSCLPSSIKCLKKLRMLSLERCTLGENLSIIAELKKLRILTLSGSNIESLPLEFGRLDKLQLFDISNCSKLRVIPSNTISRMNSLEEFYMRDSLILWEAEENIQSQKAILSELRHLNQLQNLDVHIQSVSHFPQNLFLDMLDSYKIVIGEFNMLKEGEFKIPDMYDQAKFLALNLKEGIDIHSETWVKMLFKSVEYLLLGELNDVHDVFYELNVEGFPYLKHLSIVNNFGIQYIINSVERFHPLLAFPKLESMCLYKLDNLEKICGNNHLEEASFCRLKVIKIKTCDKLENIFPFFMVGLLTMLETIEVCDCDSLKEIVSIERQTHTINDDKIEFPQLRLLTLKSLPAFACLYTNDKMPSSAQSLEVQVQNRNKDIITVVEQGATSSCISLFNEKVSIPKLEWLELSSINIQKIWSDQSQHCFQNLLTLNVTDCGDLKYLLSFSMAGSLMNLQSLFVSACEMMEDIFCPEHAENIDVFPKLKKMEIIGMEKLNTIWQPHIGLHSFHSLDSLIIGECHKLVTIFPSYMGQRFQSLQSLTITNCQLVENIFDFEIIPQTGVRNETNLQNVFLKALPNLVHIWKEDSSEILKYNNLKSISINESPNLKHLFPLSVATDLEKLEILDVYNCRAMKEIVAWGNGSNENAITFKFPQLNTVSLQNSFELMSFYRGTYALEWPSLKKLSILNCFKLEGLTKDITNSQGKPIVSATEKVIYNLESMEISLKEAEWLQKYIVSVHRMHKLQRLVLYGLKNTEILFWFLHRLPNLKSLTLGSCQLKSIWAPASLISRDKIGVVMQLKELELKSLLSLEEIGFEHHPLLQRIERLVISRCMKLTNLASSIVSYNYITHLEVRNCRSLRNLMTSSTAKSLVQLTTMKVFLCEMIVEIVAENEEEKVQEIEFRQLKSLELVSLKNLTSFCSSEKCDFKFPLLESLVVSECPQMKKFARVQSAPNLKKVHVVAGEKDKWYWEGDLNGTLQKHFTDQVSFEYSKHKRLVDYPETKAFRHGKPAFPENFFGCLKKLEFDGESIRQIVIPSHVLPYLKTLEELYVHNSDAAQIIFDTVDTEAKTKGIVFRLKKLTLEDLSNLKCVWNKNPPGTLSFPNLQQVYVFSCRSLATLFPLSLARNLGKLKTLEIQICDKLVEIVGKEDVTEHGTTEMFEFPCLWKLLLYKLSLLSCFYPGKHHLECPVLKCLDVSYCPKLKLFTSEFGDSPKQAVIEAPISQLQQQPLFSIEKIVPNLEKLTLNEEDIMLLSDAHLPQDFLFKLTDLDLSFENDDNKKDTLPFDFLQKVPSLEHLFVQSCYGLKEIFPSQKLQVHDRSLPALKQLTLFVLGELESIGLEHPWVQPYSQKLQLLSLQWCPRLEELVSCAVSFINLKELEVTNCDMMEYLLKCSTAKSLLQLESLSIRECESMKEIVKKEEEDASDEIIFGRLRTIMLDSLPRLVRFYSGNATLHFTCLRVATIAECQNMETFSEGIIEAPLLEGIKTSTEDTDHLTSHHDLNTTIETLFHQQVFFEYSKHMILVDYLETTGVRRGKPAFLKNFFGSLKKLEFDGAIKREIVIPSHVLPYLNTLEELNVHSSDAVQIIFDMDDTDANTKGIVLPLKKLTLKDLSNLKCVWNKTPRGILSFPNLQDVDVQACENLVTLFPLSLARNLGKLQTLEIHTCDKLVEIVGKEDVTEHGTTEMFEFPSLLKLLLYKLSLLSCIYPGKHHLECPVLECLDVSYCPKLKLFTSEFHNDHKEAVTEAPISRLQQQPLFSVDKIVPNLKSLTLNVENIMLLSDARLPQDLLFKLNFLALSFENDDNKKDTLPFDFLQKVPSLEHLFVQSCYGLKEIFPSQKLQVHDRTLPGLKQLSLSNLGELESIGLEHPWVKPYSQKLQLLKLWWCPQLEKLVSCAVSFINLKELEVTNCDMMEYLLKCSTAKSLLQLESLSIRECESMKEIVKKEEEDASDEIIFGRLRTIMLDSLPRLVRFYSGNATLHFTCLRVATIAECQNMETFSEGIIEAPLLEGIKTSTEDTDHLTSHHDLNTTIETLFHQQVFFEYSKHMILVDYLETTGVRRGKPAFLKNFFGSLKKLEFDGAIKREIVIPSHVLPYLNTLEELNVHSSDAVQIIFDMDDTDANTKGIVLPLKKLTLKDLSNLKCVWNKTPRGILSFPNLQDVDVQACENLVTLFPLSLARNLGKLQTLKIHTCDKLVEIVGKEDVTEHGTTEMFEFPSLLKLLLYKLSLLSCIYPGKHHLECPVLECLDVSYCPKLKLFTSEFHNDHKEAVTEAPISRLQQQPLFSVDKIVPNLKSLTLNVENIMLLSDARLPQDLLFKLTSLALSFDNDDIKKDTLPFDFLQKVPSLEELRVHTCYGLKEIFPSQKLQVHDRTLPGLTQLRLYGLGELESIGLEHPWVKPYSQKLQLLKLWWCPQLEKLVSCAVSFINLKELEVTNCDMMEYLLKCSTAKSLLQLESLSIRECESMKEIVKKEEEDASDEIIFGRLRTIMLDSLPRLVRFYSGNATLHFTCLRVATIAECQNMETFSEGIIEAPLLEGIKTSTEDTDHLTSHHDLNTTIETLFHQQVFFEYSKHMILVHYLGMTDFMHGKPAFPENFYDCLKKLEFDGASKRDIVIPSHVLPYLNTLEELNVHSSDAVQIIFDMDDTDANTKGIVLPLKKLTLKDLSNLKCVWNKTPRGILSFPNLQDVDVQACENLVTLFPLSLARNLGKLQTLKIIICDKLVEIVGKEDVMEHGTTEIFEFPYLRNLLLYKLSLLSCFYPGKHHLECPLLICLDVFYCPKLKLFTSEIHNNHKEAVTEAPISRLQQQPLFSVDKIVPNLKSLTLNEENIMLLSDARLPQDLLFKLTSLALSFDNDDIKKDTLPFDFLQKVPSLEELRVHTCYGLKEIFPSQKLQVHDRTLPGLTQLRLYGLGELESIGLEHPWVKPYSQKLQILELMECPHIEKLVSCAVSFINLKELEVTSCHRMEYLLKCSTAQSLLQLETLSIKKCKSMKEIVKKEEEDASDEIIFGSLRRIMLDSLPRLVRFYSGNATLHLKCLEEATIAECQNMKTFSEGIIDAPLLEGIKTSTDDTDHLTSHHDLNTTIETFFHQQVFFEYSKHMILLDYLEATGVRHGKPAFLKNIFGSLKKLEFDGAIKREIVIPSHVLPYLKTLEELNVHSSDAAQVIFDIDDTDANPKGMVLPLKNLTLKRLPNLKCVWNKTPQGILSFSNLQDVDVTECRSLATLFPLSLARNLGKLKTLQIFICQKLVEIVGKEDVTEHATTVMFEFPCLWKLLLYKLSLLSCFYPGKHHLECPFLTSLRVSYCPKLKLFTSEFGDSPKQAVIEAPISQLQQQPLFSVEKIAINLKELTLNEENIMLLSDGHLPQDLLFKLRFLHLSFENDDNKIDTLPFDFLQKVPSLDYLLVEMCYGLKEIFPSQKLQVHDRSLPALKQLTLFDLGELETIGLEHPWVQPYSEMLQILNLLGCPRLEELVSCAVSFINLKELQVKYCDRMEYLLKCSTAKSLLQLESLSISECESMKEIVKKEEEDGSDEIIFGRLRRIMLDSLPRLVRFYSGNATLHLKCLEEATIAECQNMKTFSEGIIDAPLLEGIKTSTEDTDLTSHHDLNTTIETLFHQQVFFEYSKQMILVDYLETTGVRRGKPAFLKNFFGSLKKLEFDGAIKREIVIPSHVLPYLKTLQELNVHSSDAAQVIFDIDDTDANPKGMVLPLKNLTLKDLSNLKCVWNKTPRGILSFPNLQQVFVTKCRSLATLFPLSLANNLVNLQTLTVRRCDKLVEIVGNEDAMELGTTERFEFPSLWKLLLYKLSLLSSFYPGKHHLECPVLKCLDVSYCPKLKLFTSEFHNSHKEAVIEQPLFMVEKVDPKLKELTLNEENIILLRDAHLPQDFLCKLNILDLSFDDYENKKDTLPFDFLHKVPSVECLRVQRCYGLKEIFPSQKLQVHHGILGRLNELFLKKLKELESIGLEHPWVKPYFAKLEILEIRKCSRLEKVVSCAVSFVSLKELQVIECERMEYLFTSSTAKSLVQLKMLYIEKCESIKEIVRKEDESDASEEMIFGRLTKLRLESLGRLVRFYSGDGTLQFSCLEEATIAECPNMNTFSEGFVNAPMFEGIKTSTEDSDLTFHHDLNSTIKMLFHQQVEKSACDIEHLKFGDHHHLEEIWLGVVPIPSNNCFKSLKSLTVVECESLSNVIPFYLLRFLCNLKEIEVSNCHSVKAIFDMKGTEADMKPTSQISLPLKKLILNQLPNLEHIWNLNPDEILSFQEFQEVCISKCQSLKSLFPTSVASHLAMLDVRSCATLEEIFVENEAVLKGETKQFNFHCLTTLTLWELPELKYFYNEKHSLEWPMLTQLDVYHCDKLKLFTTEHHSGEVADIEYPLRASIDQQAVFSVEKVMPSLEHQATTCEDNMIGQGQFVANAAHLLQNLKVLKLMCYHEDDESNIFSSGLLEEISSIENLEVFCSSFNEIISSQIPSTNYTKVLSKLKKLHLKSLQQLNSIGLEHSWVEPLLKTLETLEVFSCPNMKNLVPSTVPFSNLTSLNVEECHGLVYLFTSSTAKSLGQLKHMSIRDCQAIQEIVSREGDQESNDEEITFEQLRVLSLESLPSIVGIYSGKYKLKFPSLDQVTLMECPQMKYSYVPDLHQFKPLEQI